MSNFDTAVGATEAALNSEGSAIEENNKRMDSLQGKLTQLDSAWQQFAKNTIDSTVIKSLLGLSTNLLKFADTDSGRVILAITAMTVAWKVWQKVAQTDTIIALGAAIQKSLISVITAATISFNTGASVLSGSLNVIKVGVDALTASVMANPLFWGGAVIAGIFAVKNAIEKYNEKQLETQKTLAETNQKEATELENLKNTYEKLMDSKNRTADDNNKLKDTIETLSDKYGIEKTQLENVTGERQKAIDKINEEIKARKTAAAYAQTESVDFKGGEREALESGQGISYKSSENASFKDILSNIKAINLEFAVEGNTVADVQKKLAAYISTQSKKTDLDFREKAVLEKVTRDYNTLTTSIDTWKEGYKQALSNLAEGIDITEQQANALYSLGMITKEQFDTWQSGGKVVIETADQLATALENAQTQAKNYSSALDGNIEQMINYGKNMDILKTAQAELSNAGYITADTFKSITESGLTDYLEVTANGLTVNTNAFINSTDAIKENALANLQASTYEQIRAIVLEDMNKAEKDTTDSAKDAGTQLEKTAEQAVDSGKKILAVAGDYEQLNIQLAKIANKEYVPSESASKKIQNVLQNALKTQRFIESWKPSTSKAATKSTSSSTKKTQAEYKATIDTLYKYSNALDIAKNRVTNLNKELSNTDNLEEQEKITKQLIEALNNQIQKTNELKAAQTSQINDYINQLRQQGFAIDYNNQTNELYINNMEHLADFSGDTAKNLEKLIKKIQSLNSDNVSLDSSVRDLTTNTKKYYDQLAKYPEKKLKQFKELMENFQQSQLDQVQNQIDDLEEALKQDPKLKVLKEQLEAMKSQTDEKDKQGELEEKMLAVEKAREALENKRNQKTLQVWSKTKGWTYVADPEEIANAKQDLLDAEKDLEDTRNEQNQEALEKQIEDLENSYQDQIDKLQNFLDEQNYQIDKANRSAVQSFEELAAAMKKYGIDSAENLSKAKQWLDNYNKSLAEAKKNVTTLASSGSGVLYSSDIQGFSTSGMGANISGMSLSGVKFAPTGDTNNSSIYIDRIELPNVSNANEFVEALKTLPTLATAQATSRKK
nr:MAG TPA: chromosome segregation ATPase [Caudoviricetes sp.]